MIEYNKKTCRLTIEAVETFLVLRFIMVLFGGFGVLGRTGSFAFSCSLLKNIKK